MKRGEPDREDRFAGALLKLKNDLDVEKMKIPQGNTSINSFVRGESFMLDTVVSMFAEHFPDYKDMLVDPKTPILSLDNDDVAEEATTAKRVKSEEL